MGASSSRLVVAAALLATLVTALVFAAGLRGGFLYDDFYLIETNPALRAPGPLSHYLATPLFAGVATSGEEHWAAGGTQYWRPFLKLVFLLQFRAFGADPLGWHVVSLVVHVACVWLAFAWLRRRLGAHARGAGADALGLAAAFAAALFGLHPSRPEAVAWISGSADLWMTFWVLVGLHAWDRGSPRAAAGAAVAFALAVLCKETALVVPLCLAADAWLLHPSPARRATRARWVLVVAALAVVVAARLVLLPSPGGALRAGLAPWRALGSLGLYVARVFWPLQPSTQIGLMNAAGSFDLAAWSLVLGAATLAGVAALALAARRRAALRPLAADTLWFLLPLLPVVNLVPLGYTSLVAERFLYLPFLGIAALAARGLVAALGRPRHRAMTLAVAALVCAGYAAIDVRYLPALHDDGALWAQEIRLHPDSALLQLYRARTEWRAGRFEPGLAAARASYELAATPDTRAEAALAWATMRFQIVRGRETALLGALRDFFDALAADAGTARLQGEGASFDVRPTDAFRTDLRRNASFRGARAVAHARTGDYAGAERLLRDLLRDEPSAATAGNLARALAAQEKWAEAEAALGASDARDPGVAELRAAVAGGRTLAADATTAPDARAVQRARTWLALGMPELARHEVDELGAQQAARADVIVVRAFADALDGDVDAAGARLAAARRADPAHAAAYDAAWAQVQNAAGRAAAAPAKAGLDGLFH